MVQIPTLIYHITSIENLPSIFEQGCLFAQNAMEQEDYTNIAHQNIQDRRSQVTVSCGPGGALHDYVPFYFSPRSPMLYSISRGNVDGFSSGQSSVVHLVSTAQAVLNAGIQFVFTDGHGIMIMTDFFDDLNNLEAIDWSIMNETYWYDTPDDPDRKRRRQAEFLVYERFPAELIQEIGVMNRHTQEEVDHYLVDAGVEISVNIRQNWYY